MAIIKDQVTGNSGKPEATMSFRQNILHMANVALNRAGLQLLPQYQYRTMLTTYRGPTWEAPELPPAARDYLTWDNPRLAELKRLYHGHPAADHTQWSEQNLRKETVLAQFRGDNHYVYQTRHSPPSDKYYVTSYYVRDNDRLGLFGRLTEDGLFGAYTLPFDGDYLISRDLLDSINQINFLYRMLGKTAGESVRVLDVGAGYGRLAHRLAQAFPQAQISCIDAVPLSTFLSEFYLAFRQVRDQAHVVPLHMAETALVDHKFDVVTNIHSFSECRRSVIQWWLELLDKVQVEKLLIVPNARDEFRSTEPDGSHADYSDLLGLFRWKLVHKEPIYAHSSVAQKSGLYPNFCFHWFERH